MLGVGRGTTKDESAVVMPQIFGDADLCSRHSLPDIPISPPMLIARPTKMEYLRLCRLRAWIRDALSTFAPVDVDMQHLEVKSFLGTDCIHIRPSIAIRRQPQHHRPKARLVYSIHVLEAALSLCMVFRHHSIDNLR